MERQMIAAGWLTLRPFTTADIPWVYEVSLDPVLQHFVPVPSPYRLEDAASFAVAEVDRYRTGARLDLSGILRVGRLGLEPRTHGLKV